MFGENKQNQKKNGKYLKKLGVDYIPAKFHKDNSIFAN